MGKRCSFFVICFISTLPLQAQEPFYHVSTASPLTFNPAFAGSALTRGYNKNGRFISGRQINNYYKQPERAYHLSYDQICLRLGGAIGGMVERQSIYNGLINITSVKVLYNYILPINKHFIAKAAVEAGLENKTLDAYNYWRVGEFGLIPNIPPVYYDSIFSGEPVATLSRNYMTFGTGCLMESEKMTFGFSFQNLNRPDWAFAKGVTQRKPVKTNIHFQAAIISRKNFGVYLKSLLVYQSTASMLNAGIQLKSEQWMCGLFFNNYQLPGKNQSFAMGNIGYTFKKWIQLRYGFEYRILTPGTPTTINQSLSLQVLLRNSQYYACFKPHNINKSRYADYTF